MDYGKTAYLRLCELESQLIESGKFEPKLRSMPLNIMANSGKKIRLFSVNSSAFILSLKFKNGEKNAIISLFLGEKLIKSEKYSENLSFSVVLDERELATLYVESDAAIEIEKAEIMLLNGEAEGKQINSALDIFDEKIGFVSCDGTKIRLHINNETNFEDFSVAEGGIIVGFGLMADVCGCKFEGKTCFVVTYLDLFGNAFLLIFSTDYEVVWASCLGKNFDSLSVSYAQNTLFVAYSAQNRGKISSYFGANGTNVEPCEQIFLVKNSFPPAAICKNNRLLSLRFCKEELFSSAKISPIIELK